jgi:hypothetical protein
MLADIALQSAAFDLPIVCFEYQERSTSAEVFGD